MEGNASGEGRGGGTGGGLNGSAQQPPPFLSKTYDMVDNSTTDAVVSWGPENNSFVVWNPPEFARDLLPKYFKHSNFSSFVRQLNTYGFRKVDPDRWEFANEGFLRGKKNLLKGISRRKSSSVHSQPTQPQTQSTLLGACVEVGKFGLEEEIERLKRDKNVLMQELVRLRQQQQTTDNQLQTLGKRLQGMEQRQQQMMAFLAKAMQSPGFLAQFVQQNDSRHIASVNKKRRLPKKEDNIEGMRGSPDRQIIKYQPLVNEAANTMLMQILKMDASPTLDHANGSDAFLLDNSQSPSRALESGSSSSLSSGLTLLEVPPSTGMPYLPTNSEFPAVSPEIVVSISDIQSVTGAVDMVSTAEMVTVPDTTALSAVPHSICQSQTDAVIPNLAPVHGVIPQSDIGVMLDSSPALPSTVGEIIDPLPVDMDGLAVLGLDTFSPEPNINILGEDSSLPGINDSFWEQFLTASPVEGEEEVDSGRQETDNGMQIEQDENLDQSQCMEYLTEQMELLSPKPKG